MGRANSRRVLKKTCEHTLVPGFGKVPKRWTGAMVQFYWQCMYCGTKKKLSDEEQAGMRAYLRDCAR